MIEREYGYDTSTIVSNEQNNKIQTTINWKMSFIRAARCGIWLLAFPTRISRAVHNVAHIIQSAPYEPLPSHLRLRNVVIIHRHGDRSQITKEIGPLYPEDPQIESIWNNAMPSKETILGMAAAAALPEELLLSGSSKDPKDVIYTGWDKDKTPYGMLTDVGAKQLRNIGTELRRRYVGTLLPTNAEDVSSWLYCRSTSFCRTMQSLRSLLSGLLDTESTSFVTTTAMGEMSMSNKRLPTIVSRPKHKETMFPSADGPCLKMNERRGQIFPPDLYHTSLPFFEKLESRMKVRNYSNNITLMYPFLTPMNVIHR